MTIPAAAELASWLLPHDPEENAQREALYADLLEVIAGRSDPGEVARRWRPGDAVAVEADIRAMAVCLWPETRISQS